MSFEYLIQELRTLEGSADVIKRLKDRVDSAYSEAVLATYFSKMGFGTRLEPAGVENCKNDIAVRVNSEWINIEVKTPQRSNLQKEIEKNNEELFHVTSEIPVSRDVCIFLAKEPTCQEREAIVKKTLELALREQQPAFGKCNEVAYIKTEPITKPIWIGTTMIGQINTGTSSYPALLRPTYETTPVLFLAGVQFLNRNGADVNLSINMPFEDQRIISMLNQKRKQLSRRSMNMVALDTTHIPIKPFTKGHSEWISRLGKAFETKISRRIGAVLLFSRLSYGEKTSLHSSLFVHPNPHKNLPLSFLNKCDLNSYELPNIGQSFPTKSNTIKHQSKR